MTDPSTAECREAVLVIAFNRPALLGTLIDRLRIVKPSRLYVAVDGPRQDRPGEAAAVAACRDLVSSIDWPCTVSTLFQDSNLGCGRGVSTAITWFFSSEERGIILEDDVIPDPSFFGFCAELLDRYATDSRVFAISGTNYVPAAGLSDPSAPYRFSQVPHVWGWATWRRSWERYRLDIAGWRGELGLGTLWRRSGRSLPGSVFWGANFELMARRQVDTWDVQLAYAAMFAGQLVATSNVNLVSNIGFGEGATHTSIDRDDLQPIGSIPLPTVSVPVELDAKADAWTRRHHYQATWGGLAGQFGRYVKGRRNGRKGWT